MRKKLQERQIYGVSRLRGYWEKVEYGKPKIPDPFNFLSGDYAMKGSEFASEREYRLIFMLPNNNGQIVPTENKPIDLDVSDEIRKCCTWN